jgi:hypothetical protein
LRFSLGRRAQQWNEIAGGDRRVFSIVRAKFFERLGCQIMGQIEASDLRLLLGIAARTLRFHKFAEAISQTELCRGFRDEDDNLVLDTDDAPYFAGCNISKAETIGQAAARLEEDGLITRWTMGQRRWSTVYMPFGEDWLAETVAEAGGAIAEDYEEVVVFEHYELDGRFVRVSATTPNLIQLCPVNGRLDNAGDIYELTAAEWADANFSRLSVEQIRSARGHREVRSDCR